MVHVTGYKNPGDVIDHHSSHLYVACLYKQVFITSVGTHIKNIKIIISHSEIIMNRLLLPPLDIYNNKNDKYLFLSSYHASEVK